VAVAEERHFSRAAIRVGIEQSPLSRAIRTLECDVGARLLERSTRGSRLTLAGEIFLQHARTIIAAMDQARNAVQAAVTNPSERLSTKHLAAVAALAAAIGILDPDQ
jgi:DNA-binding transcriptional LysR family regulator